MKKLIFLAILVIVGCESVPQIDGYSYADSYNTANCDGYREKEKQKEVVAVIRVTIENEKIIEHTFVDRYVSDGLAFYNLSLYNGSNRVTLKSGSGERFFFDIPSTKNGIYYCDVYKSDEFF